MIFVGDDYLWQPFKDCELALAHGATETVTIDASFKYFVFTQHDGHGETELYPDANLKYPVKYTIEVPINPARLSVLFNLVKTCSSHQSTALQDPKMTTIPEMMERMGDMLSADADYIISMPTPGHQSHCTEIDFKNGKNNPYYQVSLFFGHIRMSCCFSHLLSDTCSMQAHGYQYTSPPWNLGHCSKKYNWFNKNETIAPGVEETLLGTH